MINKSSLYPSYQSKNHGYVGYYAKEIHKGESKVVNYCDFLFYTYKETNYLLGYAASQNDLVLPENYYGSGYDIYGFAFYNKTSLNSIVISDCVKTIGEEAFRGCTSLSSVKIPFGVTKIGYYAFYNCKSIKNIDIPNSVIEISTGAFEYCSSLLSIEIPDSVIRLSSAFGSCSSLSSVKISNNVTSIETWMFSDCKSLAEIKIPDSVISIGDRAFSGCTNLSKVEFGENSKLSSIGLAAFDGCYALKEIIISKEITLIGQSAFNTTVALVDVYYLSDEECWNAINILSNNDALLNATRYYYSETAPTTEGNYWHYVDGEPTPW